MTVLHPFRFAVVGWAAASAAAWTELARQAESRGYAVFLAPDHFANAFDPAVGLMAVADATTTLRLGVTVYAVDFRHPAVLAKEAATLDLLSGGRLEFGIGAGWDKPEYERVGIAFDPPAERVSRLAEAVRVVKGLWDADSFSFQGEHYSISAMSGFPKPVQQPHPPIYMGGGGKRLLQLAAREADIVGVMFRALPEGGLDVADDTPASLESKLGWVREAAGERFERIELATLIQKVIVTDDRHGAVERLAADWNLPPGQIEQSPYFLIGSVTEIVERLQMSRERYGFSHVSVFQRDMQAFDPVVEQLAGS